MPEMTNAQFSQLVQQYERLVYTICLRYVNNAAEAQDLSQETFLAAYRHKDECPAEEYKPWLARIASNKAKDYLKSAYHRHVQGLDEDVAVAQAHALPMEEIVLDKLQVQALHATIQSLREPYGKVCILYFLHGASVEEIARALKRPPKTVHSQLYRAKQMLQQQLRGEEAEHGNSG